MSEVTPLVWYDENCSSGGGAGGGGGVGWITFTFYSWIITIFPNVDLYLQWVACEAVYNTGPVLWVQHLIGTARDFMGTSSKIGRFVTFPFFFSEGSENPHCIQYM